MNESEKAGLSEQYKAIGNAQGKLRDLKNRAGGSVKELEKVVKLQTKEQLRKIPHYANAAVEIHKMDKLLPAALSASEALLKVAHDKKIVSLSVADAKKALLVMAKPMQAVYECCVSVSVAVNRLKDVAQADKPAGMVAPVFPVACATYADSYVKSFNEFKVALARWSTKVGMDEAQYKGIDGFLRALVSAEGFLRALKPDAAASCKELEKLVKLQSKAEMKSSPQFANALEEFKDLDKSLPAAASAFSAVVKLVSDKQKMLGFDVVDARRAIGNLAKPLHYTDACCDAAAAAWKKTKDVDRPTGAKPPVFVPKCLDSGKSYEGYIGDFKKHLDAWR